MKNVFLCICALSTIPVWATQSANLVNNGDFETGTANFFWGTPGWYNMGKGKKQDLNARSERPPIIAGRYSVGVNDRYDAGSKEHSALAHSQITKHIIQPGDVFTLSYDWFPLDQFWQNARDTVRFTLFATSDDTLGGKVVWSVELDSDFYRQALGTVKSVVQELPVVPEIAVGRKLMFMFHGIDTVDGVNGNTHFAKVDNVSITVELPKPPVARQ
jgi:hypothetical protein